MSWLKKLFSTTTEPARQLYPHEIFPELLDWRQGDKLQVQGYNFSTITEPAEYLGFLDGLLCFQLRYDNQIKKLAPTNAHKKHKNGNLYNQSLIDRRAKQEKERILKGIPNDQYNEFLKILREKETIAYEEWSKPKELKQ